jgi:hypothetical protein
MAIITIGAPLTGIRGRLGGLVFSANQSTPYVKTWAPPSQNQSNIRSIESTDLARYPDLWRGLTAAQRTAWDTFAAAAPQQLTNSLGQTYTISGFLWFVKINRQAFAVGDTVQSTAPVIARPAAPAITNFTINSIPPGGLVTFTHFAGAFAGLYMVVFTAVNQSEGVLVPLKNRRKTKTQFNPPGVLQTITTEYTAVWGEPQANYRANLFVARQTTEGVRSAFTTIQSTTL